MCLRGLFECWLSFPLSLVWETSHLLLYLPLENYAHSLHFFKYYGIQPFFHICVDHLYFSFGEACPCSMSFIRRFCFSFICKNYFCINIRNPLSIIHITHTTSHFVGSKMFLMKNFKKHDSEDDNAAHTIVSLIAFTTVVDWWSALFHLITVSTHIHLLSYLEARSRRQLISPVVF